LGQRSKKGKIEKGVTPLRWRGESRRIRFRRKNHGRTSSRKRLEKRRRVSTRREAGRGRGKKDVLERWKKTKKLGRGSNADPGRVGQCLTTSGKDRAENTPLA